MERLPDHGAKADGDHLFVRLGDSRVTYAAEHLVVLDPKATHEVVLPFDAKYRAVPCVNVSLIGQRNVGDSPAPYVCFEDTPVL